LAVSRSGLAFEVADFLGLGCGASLLAVEFLGLGCGALLRAVEFLLRLPLALFLSASPLERLVTGQVAYGLLRTSRELVEDADGSSFVAIDGLDIGYPSACCGNPAGAGRMALLDAVMRPAA
jgi:hypothetical protein